MKQYLVATSLAFLLSIGLPFAPSASAKPADLPEDDKIHCPQGQEKGEHGGVTIDLDLLSGGLAVEPPRIDAVSPTIVQAWVEQWIQMLGEACLQQGRDGVRSTSDSKEAQARQEFEAAERDRRSGHFADARNRFQRVHLLAPTSRLGRLAIDRLTEIEQRIRDAGEEAEPPIPNAEPMQSRRSLGDGWKPLGLVELTY